MKILKLTVGLFPQNHDLDASVFANELRSEWNFLPSGLRLLGRMRTQMRVPLNLQYHIDVMNSVLN